MELCTQFRKFEAHVSTTRLQTAKLWSQIHCFHSYRNSKSHFCKLLTLISSFSTLCSPGKHWSSKRHTQLPICLTHFSPVQTRLAKHFNHVWEHKRGLRWALLGCRWAPLASGDRPPLCLHGLKKSALKSGEYERKCLIGCPLLVIFFYWVPLHTINDDDEPSR